MLYFGIDPGTETGLAIWDSDHRKFIQVETTTIVRAMDCVRRYVLDEDEDRDLHLIFEDARLRKYLPRERTVSDYRGKLMGAGSVKRDCSIWEEFCKEYRVPFTAIPPQAGMTKWPAATFKAVTGWTGRTSDHARDAALLVFGK
ncbi:MAG: hypothetical protein K6A62_04620 [Bacteroidales bacterium]|nr:hypothetical protein [Bacteroidales bacterium]